MSFWGSHGRSESKAKLAGWFTLFHGGRIGWAGLSFHALLADGVYGDPCRRLAWRRGLTAGKAPSGNARFTFGRQVGDLAAFSSPSSWHHRAGVRWNRLSG